MLSNFILCWRELYQILYVGRFIVPEKNGGLLGVWRDFRMPLVEARNKCRIYVRIPLKIDLRKQIISYCAFFLAVLARSRLKNYRRFGARIVCSQLIHGGNRVDADCIMQATDWNPVTGFS